MQASASLTLGVVPSRSGSARPWLAAAALLVLAGSLLQVGGLSKAWMLAAHREPLLPPTLWSVTTQLGTGLAVIAIASLLDALRVRLLGALGVAFVLGGVATHLPKWIAPLPRPAASPLHEWMVYIGDPIGGSASMPSGHALAAFALATLLCRSSPLLARQPALRVAVLGAAALVAWSRVAVGAHWPADVLVGAGLGIGCALLAIRLALRLRLDARLRGRIGGAASMLLQGIALVMLLASPVSGPWAQPTQWLLATLLALALLLRLRGGGTERAQ